MLKKKEVDLITKLLIKSISNANLNYELDIVNLFVEEVTDKNITFNQLVSNETNNITNLFYKKLKKVCTNIYFKYDFNKKTIIKSRRISLEDKIELDKILNSIINNFYYLYLSNLSFPIHEIIEEILHDYATLRFDKYVELNNDSMTTNNIYEVVLFEKKKNEKISDNSIALTLYPFKDKKSAEKYYKKCKNIITKTKDLIEGLNWSDFVHYQNNKIEEILNSIDKKTTNHLSKM